MSNTIGFGTIQDKITNAVIGYPCVKITENESIQKSFDQSSFGKARQTFLPSSKTVSLEMDAVTEAEFWAWQFANNDRKFDKKLYISHPNDPSQTVDFTSHYYNIYSTDPWNFAQWETYSSSLSYPTPQFNATQLTNAEYTRINQIDSSTFSKSGAFSTFYFSFDISAYLALYGKDSINRLTLFMHNPWCKKTFDGSMGSFGISVQNFGSDGWGYYWQEITKVSSSISDTDLRATNQNSQQFFSIKKNALFTRISDYIGTQPQGYLNNVNFMMYNYTKNAELGFNYVGLAINGIGCKQTNTDNFTNRDPYYLSGYTTSINLTEV